MGAAVRVDALPLSPAYRRSSQRLAPGRAYDAALAGGEDYELLVAVPPRRERRARDVARKVGIPLTAIGVVTRGGGLKVMDAHGRPYAVRARGHDHLA